MDPLRPRRLRLPLIAVLVAAFGQTVTDPAPLMAQQPSQQRPPHRQGNPDTPPQAADPAADPGTAAPAGTDGAAPAVAPESDPDSAADSTPEREPAPLTFGLAGPYLAGRMAAVESDFVAAAEYFSRAVAHDQGDSYLQDSALIAMVAAGQIDGAVALAARMAGDGQTTDLSGLIDRARMIRAGEWDGLLAALEPVLDPATGGDADLLNGLVRAWGLLGAGRAQESLAAFEQMAGLPQIAPMVNYHLALARALVGDHEGAAALLADQATSSHILGVTARVQILGQLDRRDEALAVLDSIQNLESEPQLVALRAQIADGTPVPFDVVKTPADGVAQVFMTFATALAASPDPEPLSLVHARLASWLSPDIAEARLMVAQLLMERGQIDLAEAELETLRGQGEVRPLVELARIDALARADRRDQAQAAALALTQRYPDLAPAWIALGDLYRQQKQFTEAIPAYDRALELLKDAPDDQRWFPLYARGIAQERAGRFDAAEADLQAAIAIRPDQPSLLNYLGYSWIDRNENLEQGLDLIRRAVELSPDDGYILDSLAWAYFRLGRYQEAVEPMERAAVSMSSDPLVNDHLGDVYWMVGRKREAQIQWQRALSLDPGANDDVDPDRIRRKLELGLDAVMAEEKASGAGSAAPAPAAPPDTAEPSPTDAGTGAGGAAPNARD